MKDMTQKVRVAMGATAVGLAGFLMTVQPVFAQAPFTTRAPEYRTWLVRAMDQCTPAGLSVLTPGSPAAGCLQQNVTTDAGYPADPMGATMKLGRLIVSRSAAGKGRITLFGTGFQGGQRVKVRLTLRTTKKNQSTHHPFGLNSVTFADVTVECGNNTFTGCYVAGATGVIAGSMSLRDCLTNNGDSAGLASGSVEILDAALVNCDGAMKVIAVPGILN